MGLTDLIFGSFQTKIAPGSGSAFGVVTLDAAVRQLHKASAHVTRHPIEAEAGSQSDVSDHVQVDPLSIQIEGVITNTPADFLGFNQTGGADLAQEAYQELLGKLLTGQIVTVVTSLMEYPNMVLESVEVTRDKDNANSLHFSATATQITLVTMQEIAMKAPAAATKAKGQVPPKPVPKVPPPPPPPLPPSNTFLVGLTG